MQTPNRAPDFNKMFASRAEFESALNSTEQLGKTIASHAKSLSARQRPSGLDYLSSRRQAESILRSPKSRIVPSAAGRIEHILLTVPSGFDVDSGLYYVSSIYDRHFTSLVQALGDDREYTIVCHPDVETHIRSWFAPFANVRVNIVLSPRFDYSIWAQDAYIALADDNGASILAEGICFPRYEDMTVADDIAIQSRAGVLQSSLYYQGGNILGGPSTTLVGKDYVWRNTTRVGTETEAAVIDAFAEIFGTAVLTLGGKRSSYYSYLQSGVFSGYGQQPIFHIDMYVTPTGIVGTSEKEIVMLGRPQAAFEEVGMYSEDPNNDSPEIDAYFDETEEQLSEHYEVWRLPLLLTRGHLDLGEEQDQFYFLTFNNVVIENYDGKDGPERHVIMPTYVGDASTYGTNADVRARLEGAAERIWRDAGFQVHRSDGVEDLAHGNGSIHCITKVLRRGPSTS